MSPRAVRFALLGHSVSRQRCGVAFAWQSRNWITLRQNSLLVRYRGLPDTVLQSVTAPEGVPADGLDWWTGDALVIPVRKGAHGLELTIRDDSAISSLAKEILAGEEFEAKAGDIRSARVGGHSQAKRLVLVGLGEASRDDWRLAGAAAGGALQELRSSMVAGIACATSMEGVIPALQEGLWLGLHQDHRFRGSSQKDATSGPRAVELLGHVGVEADTARSAAIAKGVLFARELVNSPANILTPSALAEAAADLAAHTGLQCRILEEADCESMGMGAFLAVGRASDLPSNLIHLTYSPSAGSVKRKLGIVGKGLTFDSGGYNLKAGPGSMIEMMKFDMGGAAATLGAAATIAQLAPKDVEVHFVIAACENMVSGNVGAMRPGDIITAMNGITIEVNNTDAEGRLTLADAMLYCQDQGVTELVDVATLTGACMVALGSSYTGLWANSDAFSARIEQAARATGEKVWRMPLEKGYLDGLKSDFADCKNTGPRFGGAITAALFLEKFVRADVEWAHLDIAGTVWAEKAKGLDRVGGTGVMVRTLAQLAVDSD